MKSLSKYPVPISCCFHCPTIFFSSGSLILGEQIVHIDEFEDQLALSNNKPNFQLTPVPLFFFTIQLSRVAFLLSFSFHHENHQHSLHNHIFIVFPSPPPPPPPFFCFSLFLHHHHCHHQISIVFPSSPPHFYCFPYSTTTMHILVLMFSAFTCTVY